MTLGDRRGGVCACVIVVGLVCALVVIVSGVSRPRRVRRPGGAGEPQADESALASSSAVACASPCGGPNGARHVQAFAVACAQE